MMLYLKIHKYDGTTEFRTYDGEPLSTVKEHARVHVETGVAQRVEVLNDAKQVIDNFPPLERPGA